VLGVPPADGQLVPHTSHLDHPNKQGEIIIIIHFTTKIIQLKFIWEIFFPLMQVLPMLLGVRSFLIKFNFFAKPGGV